MKRTLVLLIWALGWCAAYAQTPSPTAGFGDVPVVKDLSYTLHTRTYYKVMEGITWEDIEPMDLLSIYPRESVERLRYTVDGNGDPLTQRTLLSQKDMYPAWATYYELTRYGEEGITSQVNAQSVSDSDLFLPTDEEEQEMMASLRADIQAHGYMGGYVYQAPTEEDLTWLSSISDQVQWSDDGQVLSSVFDSRSETWDNANLRKISESPMDEGGRIRVTHYYRADDEGTLPLLRAVVVERFMDLSNGICVTEVNIESYTDYTFDPHHPDEENAGLRMSADAYSAPAFDIFPNPLRGDLITLRMQPHLIGQPVIMHVVDAQGSSLHAVHRTITAEQETLRLSGSQYTAGLYYLVIEANGTRTSQPFFITQ
jgi:hypothetical protein